jgi:hypothetical protein
VAKKLELKIAERQGKTADGGTYKIVVGIGGLKVDGKNVDDQAVANAMCSAFEKALTSAAEEFNEC